MLSRFEPLRDKLSLRDAIDRLVEEGVNRPRGWLTSWQSGVGTFPLDIYEDGDNLIVKAAAPGIQPDDLRVEVRDDVLTISGEMRKDETRRDDKYLLREHRYGRSERSVILPFAVELDKAEAVFEHGMLTLTLPKGESLRARQIPIKARETPSAD